MCKNATKVIFHRKRPAETGENAVLIRFFHKFPKMGEICEKVRKILQLVIEIKKKGGYNISVYG